MYFIISAVFIVFTIKNVHERIYADDQQAHENLLNIISYFYCCLVAAAAAAKSLQSCPTLCNPIDGSPPGSPIPGILQARTLEWVAISLSSLMASVAQLLIQELEIKQDMRP